MKKFKILPLLVFVALLSFSVRLVQVIDGAVMMAESHLGVAHAGDKKAPEQSAPEQSTSQMQGSMLVFEDDAPKEDPAIKAAQEEKPEEEELPVFGQDQDFPKWRDPGEDDPAYEASKMEAFKDLVKRREEIESKERALVSREALLRAAEQELEQKFKELTGVRARIEGLLETQSEEEKERISSLVKIYEGMKPKDAARIFDTLDLDILVQVVSKMSERKLSPVLAAMNPERARTVTIMLAEQKQLPSLP